MIWFVATGVPGLVGPVPPPPPPLPPHAAMTTNNVNVIPVAMKFQRRRRACVAHAKSATAKSKRRIAPAGVRHPPTAMCGRSGTSELGAAVETMSVVVPLPVTVAGLKLQELSKGRPEQEDWAKVIVPL